MDYGVVKFMPVETFDDPSFGLSREEIRTQLTEEFLTNEPPSPPTVSGWPRITHAIRRDNGQELVIETSGVGFSARLKFRPAEPGAGDYEIHYPSSRKVERGQTHMVTAIKQDEKNVRVLMLIPFNIRYVVVTVNSERPHSRKAWLVGLNNFKDADIEDVEDKSD